MQKWLRHASWLMVAGLAASGSSLPAAPFTTGNLVVERVGTGSGALVNTTTPIAILEYTTGGSLVQTIDVPTTGANRQTNQSNSPVQGILNSYNGFISVAGYDQDVGLTVSQTAAVNQVFGPAGTIVSRTAAGGSGTPNYPALQVTLATGENTFYTGGSTGGAYSYNGTTYTRLNTTAPALIRSLEIYGGNLYAADNQAAGGVYQIGTGLPTTSGQSTSLVIPSGANTFGFVMFDTDANGILDLAYTADQQNGNVNGGLNRWDFNGSAWAQTYARRFATGDALSASTSSVFGMRGLTGYWDPVEQEAYLFGTTTDGGGRLVSIVDNGLAIPTSYTVLDTAGTGYAFRSVDIVSVPEPAAWPLAAVGTAGLFGLLRCRRRRPAG